MDVAERKVLDVDGIELPHFTNAWDTINTRSEDLLRPIMPSRHEKRLESI